MKLQRLEFFDERLKDVSNEYNQIHDQTKEFKNELLATVTQFETENH